MIIHQPEILITDGYIRHSVRVETRNPVIDIPQELWFRFPESYQTYLTHRCDGFVTSLLMLAMHLNEPLEARGVISEKLAYGMQEWQRVFYALAPKHLQPIDIKFNKLEISKTSDTQNKVASAYSGGLDSHYTLYHHLPQNQAIPSACLTHALFIHGFDIRLYQEERYLEIYNTYAHELNQLGIILLTAQTNAYQFTQHRLKWELAHGGALIGTALMLGNLLGRFYTNSTSWYTIVTKDIYGTNALTDHLLSTETLEVIHFGASESRMSKYPIMANWPVAQRLLRVCVDADASQGINNCGKCVRCLLNVIRLEIIGLLPKFKTFTKPFSHWDIIRLAFAEDIFPLTNKILFKSAITHRRLDIAFPMLLVIVIATLRSCLSNQVFYRLSPEKQYQIKHKVFYKKVEHGRSQTNHS